MSSCLSRRQFVGTSLGAVLLTTTRMTAHAQSDQARPIASPVAATFPRTVTHELGETTIPTKPMRVVAVGDFTDLDMLLTLGIAPVLYGLSNAWHSGVMPWQTAAEDLPSFDASGDPDLEAIAAAQPDVIVGMTSVEPVYDLLSQIAPTIVLGWDTAWRDGLTMVGTALGLDELTTTRIADGNAQIATTKAALAPIASKRLMVGFQYSDSFYIWGEETAPGKLFQELGLNFTGGDPSLLQTSLEHVNLLSDAEILLSVDSDPEVIAEQEASPLFRTLPAVQNGGYDVLAVVQSRALGDGLSPLSMPWIFPQFVDLLQKLAEGQGKKLT